MTNEEAIEIIKIAIAEVDWALTHGYSDELTIERINVNGNYEPNNCTWIPMSEQYKNKQSNWQKQELPEPYNNGGAKNDRIPKKKYYTFKSKYNGFACAGR